MKLGKVDFCKIKKITAIEIIILIIVFFAIGIYYSPHFMLKQEVMKAAKIKADNAIFTARILEEFSQYKNLKSTQIAQKVFEELNLTTKNPYNKKAPSYTFEQKCNGCNSVNCDDNTQMILLTTYNKKGELIARTVIKPPSFVTYSKFDKEKNN